MSLYQKPDEGFIMAQLREAGADKNLQITGALWIVSAVSGIGRPKTSAKIAEKRAALRRKLGEALALIESMDELDRKWFAEIQENIAEQERTIDWVTKSSPGGHRENAHAQLRDALRSFFVSEALPIEISDESPFILILAHCMGQDVESARRTLMRHYTSESIQETKEERVGREEMERAHALYVQRLTRSTPKSGSN